MRRCWVVLPLLSLGGLGLLDGCSGGEGGDGGEATDAAIVELDGGSTGDAGASSTCLAGGTSATISAALAATDRAVLCPNAEFTADAVITLADGQQLYTMGYPRRDADKALIRVPVNAAFNEPAVQAYASEKVEIRNIRIDGGRTSSFDNSASRYRALIAIAGTDSVLDHVTATNTAGLSAIAAADNPACSGLTLTFNKIIDNGFHVGPGSPWANGIDVRCSNALVANNQVRDATDGAISFYGGTNTVIEKNTISNPTRSAYSGIIAANLFGASFSGSVVRDNVVETSGGQHIHIALSVGTHSWCDDTNPTCSPNPPGVCDCQMSSGVSFSNNSGTGTYGFGIVVDGMSDATVQGNDLVMTPWTSQSCYLAGENWYVVNVAHASGGSLQAGYADRSVHWPCLGPINQ